MKYRIWSNEHNAWWRDNFCGYTKDISQAGVYDGLEEIKKRHPYLIGATPKDDDFLVPIAEEFDEKQDITPLCDKLGKLEDLMEKYKIESVEQLEEILKDYDEMAKDIVEMGLGVKVDFEG